MFGTDNDDFAQRAKKYCLDGFLLEQNYINDLKDYFTVINLLNLCKLNSIPYCFSLGGISWNRPLHKHFRTHVLTDNHLTDELDDHMTQSIDLNLWDHANHHEGPRFHVNDHDIQLQFANECIGKLKL